MVKGRLHKSSLRANMQRLGEEKEQESISYLGVQCQALQTRMIDEE